MARIAALIVFLVFPFAAFANDTAAIWGSGRASCLVWNDSKHHDWHVAAALAEWTSGYISAKNESIGGNSALTDDQVDKVVNGWLNDYCSAHPNASISDAAKAFVTNRSKKS